MAYNIDTPYLAFDPFHRKPVKTAEGLERVWNKTWSKHIEGVVWAQNMPYLNSAPMKTPV